MRRVWGAVLVMAVMSAGGAFAQLPSGEITVEGPGGTSKRITPDWAKINAQALGSRGNPIRAQGLAGQRAYLDRLRCGNGATPEVRSVGPVGVGPFTATIDSFDLECDGDIYQLYLDRHHPGHVERRAPPRFSVRAP